MKIFDGPGRGKKRCQCGLYVGVAQRTCSCGHTFTKGGSLPAQVWDIPPHDAICPVSLAENFSKADVLVWIKKVRGIYGKKRVDLTANAIKSLAVTLFEDDDALNRLNHILDNELVPA